MQSDDIDGEHKIWKINSPLIYNLANLHTLNWPSLTCQWLPFEEEKDDSKVYKLILGTHTENEENKLLICEYKISKEESGKGATNDQLVMPLKGEFGVIKSLNHNGDVNRARYMPQNSTLIATRSSDNDSFIFDSDKCVLTLHDGHSDEGYGLSWNTQVEGRLLTGSFDNTICSWDIMKTDGNSLSPSNIIRGHTDKVEDVEWNPVDRDIFASVGDDKRLLIWDYRQPQEPQLHTVAHSDEANCVNWHPVTSNLLLTGGSDEVVNLWDCRKLVNSLHSFETDSPVYRVTWAPLHETLFLSAGLKHKVHVWDIGKIGDDVLSYDEEDRSPPELIMVHSGHLNDVTDIAWHPLLKLTVSSVADDNMLNVWQIRNSILGDED